MPNNTWTRAPKGAIFSEDRLYRYLLWRTWDSKLPIAYWVMLNPSMADEFQDDATIRKCIGFSKNWLFGGIEIRNLFAKRSTIPVNLDVGPFNDAYLADIPDAPVIVAWGNVAWRYQARVNGGLEILSPRPLKCLGETLSGYPKHPVRVPYKEAPRLLDY